jgi:ribonuclease BN (tRNA processing enzyme)
MFHSTDLRDREFCSNALICAAQGNILIDAGYDIMYSLQHSGISAESIDIVMLTHLHSDHADGLEWLAYRKFFFEKKKLYVVLHESMVPDFLKRINHWRYVTDKISDASEFAASDLIELCPMAADQSLETDDLVIALLPTKHVISDIRQTSMPACSLLISGKRDYSGNTFYSGDVGNNMDVLTNVMNRMELMRIFHEVEFCSMEKASDVHMNFHFMNAQFTDDMKQKTFLYHTKTIPLEEQKKYRPFRFANTLYQYDL